MIVVDASFIDVLRTRGPLEEKKAQCLFPALLSDAIAQKTHPMDRIYALRDLLDEKLNDSISPETHLQLLLVGVAALYAFVQANWTGPPLTNYEPLFGAMEQSEAVADFHVDGEQLYVFFATTPVPLEPLVSFFSHLQLQKDRCRRAVAVGTCHSCSEHSKLQKLHLQVALERSLLFQAAGAPLRPVRDIARSADCSVEQGRLCLP
jgi:hypothetical protein